LIFCAVPVVFQWFILGLKLRVRCGKACRTPVLERSAALDLGPIGISTLADDGRCDFDRDNKVGGRSTATTKDKRI
jgi:hypothetical protein